MSVVNDRSYWVGNGMQDGQDQAALDYASGQGRDYSKRNGAWQIGYTAWLERLQRQHGKKDIQGLVLSRLNNFGRQS